VLNLRGFDTNTDGIVLPVAEDFNLGGYLHTISFSQRLDQTIGTTDATSMEPVSSCSVKAALPHLPPSSFWRERDRWTTPWSVTSSKLEKSADERRLPIDIWPHASLVKTKSTVSNPTRTDPMERCVLFSNIAGVHQQGGLESHLFQRSTGETIQHRPRLLNRDRSSDSRCFPCRCLIRLDGVGVCAWSGKTEASRIVTMHRRNYEEIDFRCAEQVPPSGRHKPLLTGDDPIQRLRKRDVHRTACRIVPPYFVASFGGHHLR